MEINFKLKKYIEENILPSYSKNDLGHDLNHITYVIGRSLKFASSIKCINYNMVYTVAAYHDIGHYIDAKNHEKLSMYILLADSNLKEFFSGEQIIIMAEAVYDHRASMNGIPRSIYGKIISSADRNTNVDDMLRRTYSYRIKHNPNDSFEQIVEESRKHIISKFGSNGYAKEKMYFDDEEYINFLNEINSLINNIDDFKKRYMLAISKINLENSGNQYVLNK